MGDVDAGAVACACVCAILNITHTAAAVSVAGGGGGRFIRSEQVVFCGRAYVHFQFAGRLISVWWWV